MGIWGLSKEISRLPEFLSFDHIMNNGLPLSLESLNRSRSKEAPCTGKLYLNSPEHWLFWCPTHDSIVRMLGACPSISRQCNGWCRMLFRCSVMSDSFCDPMDCRLRGSCLWDAVYGISQARVLEWIAISFSRGSFWPRDQTNISWIISGFFTTETPQKPFSIQ